ncbi:DUF693 family protein [Borrelia duttonii]|uniref:Uncharacterized conserved protein n=1 Tax=Borrelia duttonii (strain Ly) TaxID=412419 RepID=B5RNR1_BORDL|nr:uncharacterized conserved protein [Borrelia duttonii Ly]
MEPRLLKYDFKIEFYDQPKIYEIPKKENETQTEKAKEKSTPKEKPKEETKTEETEEKKKNTNEPKIVLRTTDGIHIDIQISDVYTSNNYICAKQAKLTIWNLPIDFNDNLQSGNIVTIYYKKFAEVKDYDFIMSGYLGTPMSTDYPSGDFSVQLEIHLASKSNYFHRALNPNQFQGMTVENAIKSAFPSRNIINMTYENKKRIINESFCANTPVEFIEKITKKYVQSVRTDIEPKDHTQLIREASLDTTHTECNYIFTNYVAIQTETEKKEETEKNKPIQKDKNPKTETPTTDTKEEETKKDTDKDYEPLEDYLLEFIPQQEVTIGSNRNIKFIYWNAKIMYTHKLKVGDKVSFIDGTGKKIKGTISQADAVLSNIGECSLILKLYDDANFLNIKGEAK